MCAKSESGTVTLKISTAFHLASCWMSFLGCSGSSGVGDRGGDGGVGWNLDDARNSEGACPIRSISTVCMLSA